MKPCACVLFVFFCTHLFGAACPGGQAKDEAALIQLEQNWAKALERHDSEMVACILADEFEDADVDGQIHNREQALAHISQRRPGSNELGEIKAHIYGAVGYVRGLNTVTDSSGNIVARVRFTDIFVYREGRWQAVSGHETLLNN
jgi:hypothetical protein